MHSLKNQCTVAISINVSFYVLKLEERTYLMALSKIAKMCSGVVTKTQQTTGEYDSMRRNPDAVNSPRILQFRVLGLILSPEKHIIN